MLYLSDGFIEIDIDDAELLYRRSSINRDWDISLHNEKQDYYYFQLTDNQYSNENIELELIDASFSLHNKQSAVVDSWILDGNKLQISALGDGVNDQSLNDDGYCYNGNWNPYEALYIYSKLEPIACFDVFVRFKLINQGADTLEVECVLKTPIKKGIFCEEEAISSLEEGDSTIQTGTPAYNKLKQYLENRSGTFARCCKHVGLIKKF